MGMNARYGLDSASEDGRVPHDKISPPPSSPNAPFPLLPFLPFILSSHQPPRTDRTYCPPPFSFHFLLCALCYLLTPPAASGMASSCLPMPVPRPVRYKDAGLSAIRLEGFTKSFSASGNNARLTVGNHSRQEAPTCGKKN